MTGKKSEQGSDVLHANKRCNNNQMLSKCLSLEFLTGLAKHTQLTSAI